MIKKETPLESRVFPQLNYKVQIAQVSLPYTNRKGQTTLVGGRQSQGERARGGGHMTTKQQSGVQNGHERRTISAKHIKAQRSEQGRGERAREREKERIV